MKTCKDCREEKPSSDFHAHHNTRDRLNIYCRPCQSARMRVWRARNLERAATRSRGDHLLKTYGITVATYDEMLADQGGGCALCGRTAEESQGDGRSLCVDHDHLTGRVRGLLCNPCNTSLGAFERNPPWAARALAYLEENR